MNFVCPNCFSSNIKFYIIRHYDPGYRYECENCDHCFDHPSKDDDEKDHDPEYEEAI